MEKVLKNDTFLSCMGHSVSINDTATNPTLKTHKHQIDIYFYLTKLWFSLASPTDKS